MARAVGIGHQDFEKLRMKNNFYVDKTGFIWESDDDVIKNGMTDFDSESVRVFTIHGLSLIIWMKEN